VKSETMGKSTDRFSPIAMHKRKKNDFVEKFGRPRESLNSHKLY
jgi:hypothetical protein